MAVDKKVSITLKGKDLASKALGKVRGTINRIKTAVFSLQGALVGVGVLLVGKFAKSFVTAFIKQQDAVESLKASLIATGKEGEASLRRLTASAAEFQKITKAGDEATIQATASLALLAPALDVTALERSQRAIIGIADVFFKGDLENAALQIGKTVGGATNSLSRYGIQIDMAGDANERLAEILEQSNRFFDVSKARAQTLGGRLARLGNSWGDLKERIGQFIGESAAVNRFLEDVRMIVEDLTSALNGKGPQIAEALAALGELAGNAFAVAFLEAIRFLGNSLEGVVDEIGTKLEAIFRRKFPAFKFVIDVVTKKVDFGGPEETARIAREVLGRTSPAAPGSLIDRLIEERRAAGGAARVRLAAAGAGFKAPSVPAALPAALGVLPGAGAIVAGLGIQKIDTRAILPRPADLRALVVSSEAFNEALEQTKASLAEAAELQKRAGEAARDAAAFAVQSWGFAMADLIRSIRGGGLFDILGGIGGIASLVNPLVGAGILVGSAVGSALFDSSGRPVHVAVDRFGTSAEDSLRGIRTGPDTIIVQLLDAQGRPIREIAADLADLERRDGTNRFSGSVQGTVTSFTEVG